MAIEMATEDLPFGLRFKVAMPGYFDPDATKTRNIVQTEMFGVRDTSIELDEDDPPEE